MKKYVSKTRSGFTLLEVLLVVAIIAILAGIVIVALNPGKQLGDSRNASRKSDVNTILSAVYQYSIDNNGNLPTVIQESVTCATPPYDPAIVPIAQTNEICKQGATSCANYIDLSATIAANQKYLTAIPTDPSGGSTNGSGYFIAQSTNGRVTVCAPATEQGATMISVTK